MLNFVTITGFAFIKVLLYLPIIIAGAFYLVPALFLQEGAGPLGEIAAPVMFCVPSAPMHFYLLLGRIFAQILGYVDGDEAKSPSSVAVENWAIKIAPKAALHVGGAEPAAIFAIRPGGYQCGEVAVLGAFVDFML